MSEFPKERFARTLREVAELSASLEDFGLRLREWEHHVSREGVHSRPALRRSLAEEPPLLSGVIPEGDVADAYLAALADWLVRKHDLVAIDWVNDSKRTANKAWWAHRARGSLLVHTPGSFRIRHVFTVPNDPFRPRRGRPPVSEVTKREKQCARQKRYRLRINKLVEAARNSFS